MGQRKYNSKTELLNYLVPGPRELYMWTCSATGVTYSQLGHLPLIFIA